MIYDLDETLLNNQSNLVSFSKMLSKKQNKSANIMDFTSSNEDIVSLMKANCDLTIEHFTQYLRNIVPNTIDLEKIKNITYHNDHTIKSLAETDKILLIPLTKTSARIEILEHQTLHSHLHHIQKNIQTSGYRVETDNNAHILKIQLNPMTEDSRKQIAHEIKVECDKHKHTVNLHRATARDSAKNMPEDDKKRCEKSIEACKDCAIKTLETKMHDKLKTILK